MSVEPKRNVYVGHRYVPKIEGVWDLMKSYEGLSIVEWEGTSYTSKKNVPAGIDISNEEFWAVTGNYNVQVENYRQEVKNLDEKLGKELNDLDQKFDEISYNIADSTGYGFKGLKVNARLDQNMTVNITPGKAYMPDGNIYNFTNNRVITIEPSTSITRTDVIYIDNNGEIKYLRDYKNANPINIDDGLIMAEILVRASSTKIYGQDVYDKRIIKKTNNELYHDIVKFKNIVNTDGAISNMIDTAMTYVDSLDFVYGNNKTLYNDDPSKNIDGKHEIDCSSFVQACLEGITYENSRYKNKYNYKRNSNDITLDSNYGIERKNHGGLLANEMARYSYDNGWLYNLENDLSNVWVGDLLFFRNSPLFQFWEGIGHVAIVTGKGQNGIIHIVEARTGGSSTVRHSVGNTIDLLKSRGVVYGARIPLGSVSSNPLPINYEPSLKMESSSRVFKRNYLKKPLKANQLYTVIMKVKYNDPNGYPWLRSNDKNIFSFGETVEKRPDNIYKTSFVITENRINEIGSDFLDQLTIEQVSPNENYGGILEYFYLYEGYVSDIPEYSDGSIVGSGKNSNGNYVMFSDGTMICSHHIVGSESNIIPTNPMGSLFKSDSETWTFPKKFKNIPSVNVNTVFTGRWACITTTPTTVDTTYEIMSAVSSDQVGAISMIAVGRWK